jgi:hypothetical protein
MSKGTYREYNHVSWAKMLPSMQNLQALELHFWTGEHFFQLIKVK